MALAPDSYQVTSGRPLRTAIVCKTIVNADSPWLASEP